MYRMGSNTSIFSQNEIDMYKVIYNSVIYCIVTEFIQQELTGLNIAEITQ